MFLPKHRLSPLVPLLLILPDGLDASVRKIAAIKK